MGYEKKWNLPQMLQKLQAFEGYNVLLFKEVNNLMDTCWFKASFDKSVLILWKRLGSKHASME